MNMLLVVWCCDQKARPASAQSFTLRQQATIQTTRGDHSVVACSRHVHIGAILSSHPVRGVLCIQHHACRAVATQVMGAFFSNFVHSPYLSKIILSLSGIRYHDLVRVYQRLLSRCRELLFNLLLYQTTKFSVIKRSTFRNNSFRGIFADVPTIQEVVAGKTVLVCITLHEQHKQDCS